MSLFAHRREYQRSIDRIFQDFSVHSRAQSEPYPEKLESNRHRSDISLGNQQEHYAQHKLENAITPEKAGGYECIQHDTKAWRCFLDSKRKE